MEVTKPTRREITVNAMNIKDSVIVVTGGGAGIGREVTRQLLDQGATVHVLDLNISGLASVGAQPDQLVPHQVNIADREAVTAVAAEITAAGPVDGLVNVAGIIQEFIDINDLDYDAIERVINVNFWGTVNTTKALLPALLERPKAAVVNVSSMGGLVPVPGQSAYGASKAAVKLFTEGLQAELLKSSVSVSIVFPGGVATDITANSGVSTPSGKTAEEAAAEAEAAASRLTTPQDAAAAIVSAIKTGKPRVRIGKDAVAMDTLGRLLPTKSITLMAKLMAKLQSS